MPHAGARRGSPDLFGFSGSGDEARLWLDTVYGTNLRLTGPLGGVEHDRTSHGAVAFDHIRIDALYTFDSDPMPMLVVVDVLRGSIEYVRDGVTDRAHDGDSVLVAGWDMPFSGTGDFPHLRTTSLSSDVLLAAVLRRPTRSTRGSASSSPPTSPALPRRARAGGRRSTRSAAIPAEATAAQEDAAARLLGHTLLHTFPNNVVVRAAPADVEGDASDDSPSTVRRAARIIEAHASEGSAPATSPASAASPLGLCSTPSASTWAARRRTTCDGSGSTSCGAPCATARQSR